MDYNAVPAPNYAAPIVNLFGNQGQKQPQQQGQQQGQPGNQGQQIGQQAGNTLASALRRFMTPGQPQPGSAVPGASGPTSVGGANGPTPLVQPGQSPSWNLAGLFS